MSIPGEVSLSVCRGSSEDDLATRYRTALDPGRGPGLHGRQFAGRFPPVSPNDLGTIGGTVNPGSDGDGSDVAVSAVVAAGILTQAYCATISNINAVASGTWIGWLLGKLQLAVPVGIIVTMDVVIAACGQLGW